MGGITRHGYTTLRLQAHIVLALRCVWPVVPWLLLVPVVQLLWRARRPTLQHADTLHGLRRQQREVLLAYA